eukprot:TRINITY_DN80083_c0_g1_i1.p1 TRINITY_DN80083_c0_g1~~TRINITY_DN80083_c0_g1_i1.p1  ORF type:complete len:316 (-),score=69.92 TRINITY_DN80083_c0_g1_i1:45-992(-)
MLSPLRSLGGVGASLSRSSRSGGWQHRGRAARGFSGLSDAQKKRALHPAFWRDYAMRVEEAGGPKALCRDAQARSIITELLPEDEQAALEQSPDAGIRAAVAGTQGAFMDKFVIDAVGKRIRQVVLLGSGMDTRACRLGVPPQLRFVEVDDAAVHAAKERVFERAAVRRRCQVQRLDISIDGTLTVDTLSEALGPRLRRQQPAIFVLDAAFHLWPAEARLAAVAAACRLSVDGSILVGPAPPAGDNHHLDHLRDAGYSKVETIDHRKLEKIYNRPVPEEASMMVALSGGPPDMRPESSGSPGSSDGSKRPREAVL